MYDLGGGVLLNKKGIIPVFVVILTILTVLISVGYSALNQNLSVSGEAFLRAKDNIRISRIELSDTENDGYETYNPEYSKRTTKMYTTLPKDDSSVTYTVKVTNSTGIKYKVDSIEVTSTNSNVSCTPSIEVNTILEDGITEFTVTANYENGMSQDTNLNACDIKYEFVPLDVTPPTLAVQLVSDNGNTKTIKITATDEADGSGISDENNFKYYLSTSSTTLTGGEWKDYINSTEFEINGDFEVKYLWIYPVKDKAGNINDNKTNINIAYVIKTYTFVDNAPTLYNVIAKEALTGGVAKLYTGEHNDTYDESGTRKIFHFHGENDEQATEVLSKNNVIFAGYCWQMLRTTDTGGTKLLYNGKVKEEYDEFSSISESEYNVTSNDDSYPYTYDSSTNMWIGPNDGYESRITFSVTTPGNYYLNYTLSSEYSGDEVSFYKNDTLIFSKMPDDYYMSITELVNLGFLMENDIITVEYYRDYYLDGDNFTFALTKPIGKARYTCRNSGEEQIMEVSPFNNGNEYSSLAYAGYMYNSVYLSGGKKMYTTESIFDESAYLYSDYWYADSILYDSSTGKYSLVNPYRVSSKSEYASLKGKYTFEKGTETYTSSTVYYIGGISGIYYYGIILSDGNMIDHYNSTYTYGASYTKNDDGTYTINEPSTIQKTAYYDNYTNLEGKYVCKNAVNNSCDILWYVYKSYSSSFYWVTSENEYKYAKDFTYTDGKYVLNDESVMVWNVSDSSELEKLNNAHYTCFNTTGECNTAYYVYELTNNKLYYMELKNGIDVEEVLQEMLSADNVNKTNSTIKDKIDTWYANNMVSYTEYLEDTVFCNDRSISNYGGWNYDGGSIKNDNDLLFNNFKATNNLYCTNLTDRFSVGNEKAKLTYPVGLVSAPEMQLLWNSNVRLTSLSYWLISPSRYEHFQGRINIYKSSGEFYVTDPGGIRPAISLMPGTRYATGAGSTTDPYIVDLNAPTITLETLIDGEREKYIRIIINDDTVLSSNNQYKYYLSISETEPLGGEWKDYVPGEMIALTGENQTRYLWIYPVMDKAGNINDNKVDVNSPYVVSSYIFKDLPHYLYDVIKKEVASGSGLAKLYDGQHNDTYNETGTENIYYFHGADDTAATSVLNRNNVLFAGFCWQMIRTTDTGGTKLIYNGIPKEQDGKKVCTNSGTEQQIGTSEFNTYYSSPAYVGYMYNTVYENKYKDLATTEYMLSDYDYPLSTSYWYADSISFDSSTYMYSLVNPYKVNSTSDYASLKGKYTFGSTTESYTSYTVYYIGGIYDNNYYRISLSIGNTIEYYDDIYTYGTSYTKNENGTYTINEPSTIQKTTYYDNYTNLEGKYVCKNAINNSCNTLWYVVASYNRKFMWVSPENEYKYAKGFTYIDGRYVLDDKSVTILDINLSNEKTKLSNAHYTCFNTTGECNTIYYIHAPAFNETAIYYIELEDGKSIENALNEMLSADNVNKTNSPIKDTIDTWYASNMTNYTEYLEDTVFCNDRSISDYGGWNPNGGSISNYLRFKNYNSSTGDLYCTNVTDRFSVGNEKARLTYPIGLMSAQEMYLQGNNNIRKTGEWYWLESPDFFAAYNAYGLYVDTDGRLFDSFYVGANTIGVRPSVSLIKDTQYSSGTGSVTDPYVILTN